MARQLAQQLVGVVQGRANAGRSNWCTCQVWDCTAMTRQLAQQGRSGVSCSASPAYTE